MLSDATMSAQFTVYVDPLKSPDEIIAKGTKENPFHDLFSAFLAHPLESRVPPQKFLILDADSAEWRPATKSALKKAASRYDKHTKKVHTLGEEEELRQARQAALVEVRKFVPKSDSSLPAPINLKNFARHQDHVILGDDTTTGSRVRVVGRVDNIRTSKARTFVYLTDTRGYLLCIFSGELNQAIPVLLQKQASIEIIGEMKRAPPEKHAPDNRELHVDFYNIIGEAPGGPESFIKKVPKTASESVLINILLANEEIASYFKSLNPDFKASSCPFRRMRYTEALEWLNEYGAKTDEGKDHVFGDEIVEVTERAMTNSIGVPIMLNHFPSPSKAFYM
jgi:asparaginyl-tRNA synthetase